MDYLPSIILWAVIIGALIYNFVIKKNKNRSAALDGADKKRMKQAIEPLLREPENFRIVYAHREEQSSYGRTVRTTYYRYAAAFQNDTLVVFPLGIDKKTGEMQAAKPMVLGPSALGKITVKTKEKDGTATQVVAWLGDKQGHVIVELTVDAENLRKNRWFPVNILQEEELAAFQRFITQLAQKVAAENPGVDALIAAESNEGLGIIGAGVSILGSILGIFLPPLGLAASVIGLIMAGVSKAKGAKGKAPLIITIVCLVLMAAANVYILRIFLG